MRYAIVDKNTSTIVNIVEYASPPSEPPPGMDDNFTAVAGSTFDIGWVLQDGSFVDPNPPAPPSPPTRYTVTPLQFRLELIEQNLFDSVQSAVDAAAAAGNKMVKTYWEFASVIESDHPLVQALGASINLQPANILALFKAAAERSP
jgi:hypothetical protein